MISSSTIDLNKDLPGVPLVASGVICLGWAVEHRIPGCVRVVIVLSSIFGLIAIVPKSAMLHSIITVIQRNKYMGRYCCF